VIVLDASVLIGYLEEGDPHHQEAVELLVELSDQYLFVPAFTWAEVLVGAVKLGKVETAVDWINRKLGVAIANPEGADWPLQLAEMRARTNLKMPDASLLATAEVLNAEVATFDSKLTAIAASEGLLYQPPADN